ncbi:MAG TPA: hypothetical protein VE868_07725 [Balneolaceae bacterium]|nr:hypothetical protein [Balneolaceae bacterium]
MTLFSFLLSGFFIGTGKSSAQTFRGRGGDSALLTVASVKPLRNFGAGEDGAALSFFSNPN